ncbi:MAG TPA: hypothetical protein VK689_02850, partial [Armatimonadota bacterium]|nr:hypothetical protein [Armatimonadota bacterium]
MEITWSTGARVLRGFWERYWEELSMDPAHIRMGRLNNGAPFLADHASWQVRDTPGVIERAWLTKAADGSVVGRALVRFVRAGVDAKADKLFEKIADGIVANVSVGYRVHKMEKIEDGEGEIPVYRAVDWEPHEISAVAMGADDGAGFRSADQTHNPVEVRTEDMSDAKNQDQTPEQIRAERERCATITTLCQRNKLPELGAELVRNGTPLDQARALILDKLAERSDNDGTSQAPSGAAERGYGGHADADTRVRDMGAALASRAG